MSSKHITESSDSYQSERNRSRRNKGRKGAGKTLSVILAALLFAAAVILVTAEFRSIKRSSSPAADAAPLKPAEDLTPTPVLPTPEPTISPEELKAREEEERARAEALKKEASQYSFYQKLEKGYGVSILVLGDASAAAPESDGISGIVDGPGFSALSEYLNGKYPSKTSAGASVVNLASEKGNLLYDAMRVKNMPEEPSYDLVILSYGMNEQSAETAAAYEALIIALKSRFPDSSIIYTVEPCFHGMTPELETMQTLSADYGIPVINLFSVFYNKGVDTYFDYFEKDQTTLSDKGQEEWIKLLCELIDENVAESEGKMKDVPAISAKAEEITKLQFIPVSDSRVSRKDDTSYTLDFKAKGLSYVQHGKMLEAGDAKVIADDILYSFGKPSGAETPAGSFITMLHDDLQCEKSFEIVFSGKELADGLEGFYLIENAA